MKTEQIDKARLLAAGVGIYDDAIELAVALRHYLPPNHPHRYWAAEAAVSLEGMWHHMNKMAKFLKELERGEE